MATWAKNCLFSEHLEHTLCEINSISYCNSQQIFMKSRNPGQKFRKSIQSTWVQILYETNRNFGCICIKYTGMDCGHCSQSVNGLDLEILAGT